MNLDRFLLAENPRTDGGLAIIHTLDPIAIIEVKDGMRIRHPSDTQHFKSFEHGNEMITLTIFHLFTPNMAALDDQIAHDMAQKLLKRAWHWYAAYLEWEDSQ